MLIEVDLPADFPPPRVPREPIARNLRDIIPAGKGRVDKAEYLARLRRGQRAGMRSLLTLMNTEHSHDWRRPTVVCIVVVGPSLAEEVGALRHLIKRGAKVLAVNKSHDWLLQRGLRCDYAALLDPKEWVADYIDLDLAAAKSTRKRAGKFWAPPKYLIASQCHDLVLEKFKHRKEAYMWHAAAGLGESEILKTEFADELWVNIAGASVIGLRAVGLAHGLGFREMHLFGIDGSMKPAADDSSPKLYAYDKPYIDKTWKAFEVKLTSGWRRAFMAITTWRAASTSLKTPCAIGTARSKPERWSPFPCACTATRTTPPSPWSPPAWACMRRRRRMRLMARHRPKPSPPSSRPLPYAPSPSRACRDRRSLQRDGVLA